MRPPVHPFVASPPPYVTATPTLRRDGVLAPEKGGAEPLERGFAVGIGERKPRFREPLQPVYRRMSL